MRAASLGKSLVISCFIVATVAKYGVDMESQCDLTCFKCLKKKHDADFFIGHLTESWTGRYDNKGGSNIVNAIKAKYSIVEGYIYPCLIKGCPNATQQVQNAVNGLSSTSKFLTSFRIWVDVEIYDNHNPWPKNKAYNQEFIRNMTNELQRLGRPTGIYTKADNWAAVVGTKWTELADLPLWWSRATGYEDLRLFEPFGGWTNKTVEYHQYKIGQHLTDCSSAQIDLDWKPCPANWTFVRKARRCLRVASEYTSWDGGRAQCKQWGGELVSIHSAEANSAIVDFAYNTSGYDSSNGAWFNVGLQRSDPSSQWSWTDGTSLNYTSNWCGTQCSADGNDGVLVAVGVFGTYSGAPQWNGTWATVKRDDESQWRAICQHK